MMNLDLNKKYFRLSFPFSKKTNPEDFGLTKTLRKEIFKDDTDNSKWLRQDLYDFGWGKEPGFVRIPIPDFEDLWELLVNSPVEDNRYGAAHILETKYPEKLLQKVLENIDFSMLKKRDILTEALQILHLKEGTNRSEILNKTDQEIKEDFKKWQYVAKRLKVINNQPD